MSSIQHNDPDESIQPLPEDNDPPFSPPDGTDADADDSDVDIQEQYDEGKAPELEPDEGNEIAGYDPENDQRNSSGQ